MMQTSFDCGFLASSEGIVTTKAEKKRVEACMLTAARKAGVPIPSGEIASEEPDFRFDHEIPALGIELSEVLRPASSNHGILPVEQAECGIPSK